MYEILILFLVAIDQFIKNIVLKNLKGMGQIQVVDGVFNFTYVENYGAAFGMLKNAKYIFIFVALVATIVGIVFIHRNDISKIFKLSIAMIISGAIGNMIDRFRFGYVIDYFDFQFIWQYVFNFADVCVVLGTIILCICIFRMDLEVEKK